MKVKVKVKSLSHVRLLATPWTAAHQAPRSMGFSRQKYWSGVPLPFLSCMLGMSKAESTAKVQGRRTQNMKTRLMMLWVKGETLGLSDTEFYKGRPSCPHLYAQVGSLTRRKLSRDREGRIVITRTWPCESQTHSVMSDSSWPLVLYSPWNSQARILEWVVFPFSRGIFPTQGLNPGLPHCRLTHYELIHRWSQRILERVAYPFSSGSSWPRNPARVSCTAARLFTNWAIREALDLTLVRVLNRYWFRQHPGHGRRSPSLPEKGEQRFCTILATLY